MKDSFQVNELLDVIYSSKVVTDSEGNEYRLVGEISPAEGQFLLDMVNRYDARNIIEIGLAYGISSLYLSQALSTKEGGHLTSIDPYQSTYFYGVGKANLERVNFSSHTFYEDPSEYVLPQLIKQGQVFDMAFVDGNHDFEFVMTDFLMLNRLLKPGGIIVFDDCNIPAVSLTIQLALGLGELSGQHGVYQVAGVLEKQGKGGAGLKKKARRLIDQGAYSMTQSGVKPLPDVISQGRPSMIALQRLPMKFTEADIRSILKTADVDENQLHMDPIEICQKFAITPQQLAEWRKAYS